MTNCEHLIENALFAQQYIRKGNLNDYTKARDNFINNELNLSMAECEKISLAKVWEMASYVNYTWCDVLLELRERDYDDRAGR